jgi:hypothetical protein
MVQVFNFLSSLSCCGHFWDGGFVLESLWPWCLGFHCSLNLVPFDLQLCLCASSFAGARWIHEVSALPKP